MVMVVVRNWIFRPEVPTTPETVDPPALDTVVHGPSTCVDVDTGLPCEPLRGWSSMAGQDAGDNQGESSLPLSLLPV